MKQILQHLFEHKTLSREQASDVLTRIAEGAFNEHQITSFMTVYLMRSITVEELQGFQDALLKLCVPVDLGTHDLMDIVGTGGDGKNTFNISTLACFVVAGAGQKVAKHGNYGASTISGASNVMEQLGYTFKNDSEKLRKEVEESGICFLHAPMFHPALKVVGPIRKNLGMRTFFNMLGPMVNPARPAHQVIGVFSLEMARVYTYLLQKMDRNFTIVHGLDGYDEISLTNDTKVITPRGEQIWSAAALGGSTVTQESITGGNTVQEAATIFKNILEGKGTAAQNAVVLANAAIALQSTENYQNYDAAFEAATVSLMEGKALTCLQKLVALQ